MRGTIWMNKVFEAKNIYNNPMKINIERTS